MGSKRLTVIPRGANGLRVDLYDPYVSRDNCVAHVFLNLPRQRKRDDYLVKLAAQLAAAPAMATALRRILAIAAKSSDVELVNAATIARDAYESACDIEDIIS